MRTLTKLASGLTLLISSVVWGQGLTPMNYQEGPGIKLTDQLVIHPGAVLEGRFDSNPVLADSTQAAPYLRIIAHFDLATRSPQRLSDGEGRASLQKIEFRLKSAFAYREYFSDNETILQQRGVEVTAGLNFKVNPSRVFSFEVRNDFQRAITPRDQQLLSGAENTTQELSTIIYNINTAGARVNLVPGGGRLTFVAGYDFGFQIYEGTGLENLDRFLHEVMFNASWKLFPQTALFLNVTQGFFDYFNADPTSQLQPVNVQSKPLRAVVGLTGLITPKFSTRLQVGYGNAFYDGTDSSFSAPIGLAEFTYRIAQAASFTFGYEYLFSDSSYANYFTDHKAYLSYSHTIAQRFILSFLADYRFRQFKGFDTVNAFNTAQGATAAVTEFDAHVITGSAGLDYKIQEWFYVGLAYDIGTRNIAAGGDPLIAAGVYGANDYVRHQVIGRVGASY